jgi:hypothetical protein
VPLLEINKKALRMCLCVCVSICKEMIFSWWYFRKMFVSIGSRGSSVSIVSDYELDDRGSTPDRGREFFFCPCVQTGSRAHPASCPMGTGGKARPGRDADHSPPSCAKVKYIWVGAIPPLPPCAAMACSGTALLFFFVCIYLHGAESFFRSR